MANLGNERDMTDVDGSGGTEKRGETHDVAVRRLTQAGNRTRTTMQTRKSIATRQRIMDVATQVMNECGTTAFQMSEVSRRCHMSKGALYYYFDDKEALVEAVFDSTADDLVRAVDEAAAKDASAEEILYDLCNEFTQRVREGGSLAMALVRDLVRTREGLVAQEETRIHHIIDIVAQQFDRAKEEGHVRADLNSRLVAEAVCGGFTFAAIRAGEPASDDMNFSAELLSIVVDGIGVDA